MIKALLLTSLISHAGWGTRCLRLFAQADPYQYEEASFSWVAAEYQRRGIQAAWHKPHDAETFHILGNEIRNRIKRGPQLTQQDLEQAEELLAIYSSFEIK